MDRSPNQSPDHWTSLTASGRSSAYC